MKQPQKKFQDYRVKIFLVLLKTFKALKLFQIQKIVRKIKSDRTKPEEVPKLETKLTHMKSIGVKDCRNLSFYIMKYQMKLDTQAEKLFFKFQVPENEKLTEQYLAENESQEKFLKSIQDNKRYKTALESLEGLLDMVDRKKNKTKQHRVIKKEKYQLKLQYKQDKQNLEPVLIRTEEQIAKSLLNKQSREIKKAQKIQKSLLTLNEKAEPVQKRIDPKNRPTHKQVEFKNKWQNQVQLNQTPVQEPQKLNEPDYTFSSMHPSWQAKIELKQLESNFGQFAGKKIKLC